MTVQCKICPVCLGTKVQDIANRLPKGRKEFLCENCRGEGIVPLVTCRGCGRPAMHWDAKVPFCGRKECWERLVEMVNPNERPRALPRGFSPFPLVGPRNSVTRGWNPSRKEFERFPFSCSGSHMTEEEEERFYNLCAGNC